MSEDEDTGEARAHGAHGPRTRSRVGRPSLSETHRRGVRLDIARAAVDLFRTRGVEHTSAADIAEAAGISSRTLWRYVPSKEETLTSLFGLAAEGLAARLREWPRDQALGDFLTGDSWRRDMDADTRELLREATRLSRTEPTLRKVTVQAAFEFQSRIAAVFAERAGRSEPDLEAKVQAAMLLATLSIVEQEYAWYHEGPEDEAQRSELARRALRAASEGLPL